MWHFSNFNFPISLDFGNKAPNQVIYFNEVCARMLNSNHGLHIDEWTKSSSFSADIIKYIFLKETLCFGLYVAETRFNLRCVTIGSVNGAYQHKIHASTTPMMKLFAQFTNIIEYKKPLITNDQCS